MQNSNRAMKRADRWSAPGCSPRIGLETLQEDYKKLREAKEETLPSRQEIQGTVTETGTDPDVRTLVQKPYKSNGFLCRQVPVFPG